MIKSDTIKYNDKTIYTDTVQLELKLRDKNWMDAIWEQGVKRLLLTIQDPLHAVQ